MFQPFPTRSFPASVPKVALSHAILTMLNAIRPASTPEGYAPEAGSAASDMPRSGSTALPTQAIDIAIDDWNVLFRAIEDRLRLTVGGDPLANALTTTDAPAHEAAVGVRTIVLECVAALEQLHTALTHERGRREQLELAAHDAQAALARALEKSAAGGSGNSGFVV
ncbi:MAG: hypothetical protein ACYCZ6_16040 [Polaromonas sp.]